jgi:hypothetical protein
MLSAISSLIAPNPIQRCSASSVKHDHKLSVGHIVGREEGKPELDTACQQESSLMNLCKCEVICSIASLSYH